MKFISAFLGITIFVQLSAGEIFFDQIGPVDGSGIGLQGFANQDFEPALSQYDTACADNISILTPTTLSNAEILIRGFGGFVDASGITNYQLNFYSTPSAAGANLVGDVASLDVDPADATIDSQWAGDGFLVSIPTTISLQPGNFWMGILPSNDMSINGQVAIYESLLGDGQLAIWANPGGGFGGGAWDYIPFELAYRLSDIATPNPCEDNLSACANDVDGDGTVAVSDILAIISVWGTCGDGTFRPQGDVAPLPAGDCCVNVSDLLAVIGDWGLSLDCAPVGACCFDTGICTDNIRQPDCETNGGFFFGEGSYCMFEDCGIGACCTSTTECIENVTAWTCNSLQGSFKGSETICDNVYCDQVPGDECNTALTVLDGANAFDTTFMTPSLPEPASFGNDNNYNWDCFSDNFNWNNSSDGWFVYVATQSGPATFSTCDINSYDTSIALYAGGCDPPNQVRCNGDSDLDGTNCQAFFSSIEYNVVSGETYYIRIGSHNGESVGVGTLTITPAPAGVGACCFEGSCLGDSWEISVCFSFEGEFMGVGTLCSDPEICAAPEPPPNDHCSTATELFIGQNAFDTTNADRDFTPVNESFCYSTNLNWCFVDQGILLCAPDVWFFYVAPASETVRFSTCDSTSYDTSLVLYEVGCNNESFQVACNGDGTGLTNCQLYYSSIEYNLIAGETYFLRVGGWEGAAGIGTVTVSPVGSGAIGACCVNGICSDVITETACQDLLGQWTLDAFCSTVVCEQPVCPTAVVSQNPNDNTPGSWNAVTSADDITTGVFYNRASNAGAASLSSFTVWGIEAFNPANQWTTCSGVDTFRVVTYTDDGTGLPGAIVAQDVAITPIRTGTGTFYNGVYELFSYEFSFVSSAFDHISVQSNSDGLDCWFLWMNSSMGDGICTVDSGTGWSISNEDLSICIIE